MFSTIGRMVVGVSDQDEALAFYRDVLGFEVLHDEDTEGLRYLHIGLPGQPGTGLVADARHAARPPARCSCSTPTISTASTPALRARGVETWARNASVAALLRRRGQRHRGGRAVAARRCAASARTCSCSTARLSCASVRLTLPAHDRAGELLGQPRPDPAARRRRTAAAARPACSSRAVAQPPAPALVDAGDRRPGQVALRAGTRPSSISPPTSAEPTRISIR